VPLPVRLNVRTLVYEFRSLPTELRPFWYLCQVTRSTELNIVYWYVSYFRQKKKITFYLDITLSRDIEKGNKEKRFRYILGKRRGKTESKLHTSK